MSEDLILLQLLRLKGRATTAELASAIGSASSSTDAVIERNLAAGLCEEKAGRFKLTKEGRERVREMVSAERDGIDPTAIDRLYEEFCEFNKAFKELMLDWQVRDGKPNEHLDQDYDAGVIDRIGRLDQAFEPLLNQLGDVAPRLRMYRGRFSHALQLAREGDPSWVAKPLADSFHTVWFELHEDLIGLTGRTRAAEASAGRAE